MSFFGILAVALLVVAVYKIANDRGKRKATKQIIKREEALDREELANEKENRDHTNAYDELDNVINRGKRKK